MGGGEEFLLQQLEEERGRGQALEAELAAARASAGAGTGAGAEDEELHAARIRLAEAEASRAGLERELRAALEDRTIALDQREDMVEALDTLRRQLADIRRSAPPTPERGADAAVASTAAGDMQALREKASGLERSRKILLSEVEAQNLEMERLFSDNEQLARSAKEAQQASARLQEMLEEQSHWKPSENGASTNGDMASSGPKDTSHSREPPAGWDPEGVSLRLRDAEAQNAVLQAQVAQFSAEAGRAQTAYSDLARAIGPVLEGVEQRLARIRCEQYLRQQQQEQL